MLCSSLLKIEDRSWVAKVVKKILFWLKGTFLIGFKINNGNSLLSQSKRTLWQLFSCVVVYQENI